MDAQAFTRHLAESGVTLTANGDQITAIPAGRLSDTDRAFIKARKPELLALLNGSDLPRPWNAIRDLTAQGWRADFEPPDVTGKQAVSWVPPDPATRIPETAPGETLYRSVRVTDATGTVEYHTPPGMSQSQWWCLVGQHHAEPFRVEITAESGGLPAAQSTPTGTTNADASGEPITTKNAAPVRCTDCQHQVPIEWHPALVGCKAGVPAPGPTGRRWKSDPHTCPNFTASEVSP